MNGNDDRCFIIEFFYNRCSGAYARFIVHGWNRGACECFVRELVYNDSRFFADIHCTIRSWDDVNNCYAD